MSELNKVKLGKRLTAIEEQVKSGYHHIWDCCCDHGLLGFALLEQGKGHNIHFVDIVPSLLIEIENKLTRFYQGGKAWHVHCLDVAELPLATDRSVKHLIIIAGVGGLLLVELLNKLLPLTKTLDVEFILSPVHHNYQLRSFLKDNQCTLIDEFIIAENKRFYEVMHVHNKAGSAISLVGDKMWDFDKPDHQDYLQQTIAHYQRMAKNPNVDVAEIMSAYIDVLTRAKI